MPEFLEKDLSKAADDSGLTGDDKAGYIYGTMNKIGAMHGNKLTAKGRSMQKKHDEKKRGGFPLKKKKKNGFNTHNN